MKVTYIYFLSLVIFLSGCSSPGNTTPGPTASLTPEQNMEKIKNDPKIPDGLKQIQMDTLKAQPGAKP